MTNLTSLQERNNPTMLTTQANEQESRGMKFQLDTASLVVYKEKSDQHQTITIITTTIEILVYGVSCAKNENQLQVLIQGHKRVNLLR